MAPFYQYKVPKSDNTDLTETNSAHVLFDLLDLPK